MPGKTIDNQRRALDAVARVLEERHGARRANVASPEDERIDPPVEYVFDLEAGSRRNWSPASRSRRGQKCRSAILSPTLPS